MKLEPLENERWVWAKTFNNEDYSHYLVSDKGRCWNCNTEQFVGHWLNDDYWMIRLSKNNKKETMMIGRLMLISFGIPIPEHLQGLPKNKLQAMHLDGNSKNNSLENFQWGDAKENANEVNCKKKQSEAKKGKYGKNHNRSKPILQYSKDGELIRNWDSIIDVQRKLGINHSDISKCAKGKLGSAGGYIWKYKEEVA